MLASKTAVLNQQFVDFFPLLVLEILERQVDFKTIASPGDDFISVMPTNLYGPGDDYHPENSHVIPGLIRRIHEAKIANAPEVAVWGSGEPRREFMFVDDLADACVFLMKSWAGREHINVGSGIDMTIAELARAIVRTVGYGGKITFDTSRPDGTPRKLLDVSRINALGWKAQTPLETGLKAAYADFLVRAEDAMYA